MGQEPTPATTGQEPGTSPTPPNSGGEPKVFDEDYVKRLRSEAASYRTELQQTKTALQKFEDSQKSDLERLTGERDQFKTQAEQTASETLRLRVALSKGLIGERAGLADRLKGSTQAELEADADELLKLAGATTASTSFDAGARGGDTPQGMDAAIRRAAGR